VHRHAEGRDLVRLEDHGLEHVLEHPPPLLERPRIVTAVLKGEPAGEATLLRKYEIEDVDMAILGQ
jgi:hypothetical protein